MDAYDNIRRGEKGIWISIAAYISLSAVKIYMGAQAGSDALLADGFNNTTDIIASIAILIGLKISRKPPDRDHRYGHFRAETVASLVASFIMVTVGVQVAYQAVLSFFGPEVQIPHMSSAWTALGCALVMLFVYAYNAGLARKLNSQAMLAAAKDNRSDALVSLGAFAGIVGSQFGLPWLDPFTAVIVGLLICRTAWGIFHDASQALTDGFEETQLVVIRRTIRDTPGVVAIKDIKARAHGNQVLVDVVIDVKGELNVVDSHEITVNVEDRLRVKHGINYVHVHIEPDHIPE